jgi:hypothetical protein
VLKRDEPNEGNHEKIHPVIGVEEEEKVLNVIKEVPHQKDSSYLQEDQAHHLVDSSF